MRKLKFVLKIFLLIFLGFLLNILICFIYPNVSRMEKENPKKTSFMEYREREWEREGKEITLRQNWVPLNRISEHLIKAVTIAEDDKFWEHDGFDYEAIQKAIEKDLLEKKFKLGGSTITQQLAKNLFLSPSKNPIRKIKEAILTRRLEKNLSKKRILEIYLNVIEWGEGIFGIEAAAQHYFKKAAKNLTTIESARLAAVIPNPRKFNPVSHSKYVEKRTRIIYSRMLKKG